MERGPLCDMSYDQISSMIGVNYTGVVNIAKEAFPYLKQTAGMLLLTASSSYTRGRKDYVLYSSLKAATVNMTQALSSEWHKDNVKVNCIVPARTKTPMREKAFGVENNDLLLSPEIVAEQIIRLMATTTTGEILDIIKKNQATLTQEDEATKIA